MVKVISIPYIFQVLYALCFTRPRYQVSVYRTIGPLVYHLLSPAFSKKNGGNCIQLSVLLCFRLSVTSAVPSRSRYIVCATPPIVLKLYRFFGHGLKMCMWFGYTP